MTTTGDLFINIKGNNSGLKKSLNQSTRDIQNFSARTEKAMGKGGGMGFGGIAAVAGASQAQNIMRAAQVQLGAFRNRNAWGEGMNGLRQLKQGEDQLGSMRRHAAHNGDIGRYRQLGSMHAQARNRRRDFVGTMKGVRDNENAAAAALNPMKAMATPAVAAAVAAVAGTVLIANASKWSNRINEASMQFSGAAIGNQARLDAANMRTDIRLAKGGTAVTRQNAADYRKNSGGGGEFANLAGSAWDYTMGGIGNYLYYQMGGELISQTYKALSTEGGIK